MKSLIFTGPESTGKTTLAQHLSKVLDIKLILEYSRTYLSSRNGEYHYEDLAIMAKNAQKEINAQATENLILDTDILTYKVWSQIKYKKTDPWIDSNLHDDRDKLYLLCYPDLEWTADPLRENPHDRLSLFTAYEDLLMTFNLNYYIICGKNSRLSSTLEIATNYFNF